MINRRCSCKITSVSSCCCCYYCCCRCSCFLCLAVWDSSIVVAKYLEKLGAGALKSKRCLDLSAGCGLVGEGQGPKNRHASPMHTPRLRTRLAHAHASPMHTQCATSSRDCLTGCLQMMILQPRIRRCLTHNTPAVRPCCAVVCCAVLCCASARPCHGKTGWGCDGDRPGWEPAVAAAQLHSQRCVRPRCSHTHTHTVCLPA